MHQPAHANSAFDQAKEPELHFVEATIVVLELSLGFRKSVRFGQSAKESSMSRIAGLSFSQRRIR